MPLGWGVWGVNIAISCGSIARGLSQVRPSWPGGKSSGRVIIAASRGISARADLSQITHNDDAFAFSGEDICVTSCEGLPVIVRPSSLLAMSDNCISASVYTLFADFVRYNGYNSISYYLQMPRKSQSDFVIP